MKYATAISPQVINATSGTKTPKTNNTRRQTLLFPRYKVNRTGIPGGIGGNPNSFWEPCHKNKDPITILNIE